MEDRDTLSLELGKDEALVLFDMLGRWIEDEKGLSIKAQTRDDAELWALNGVYGRLMSILAEPFRSDFNIIVKRARQAVCARHGGEWAYAK